MIDGLRIGLGLDTHRLEAGRPCRLGGILIDSPVGPVGHSDADVILHAVVDAVLSAAGQDDLGTLFSDQSAVNADRDSAEFCHEAHRLAQAAGFRILSLDVVVEAEQPRLAPHRLAIRQRLADLFHTTLDRINLRGKTAEKLGSIGQGQAIRATAIALLSKDLPG